MHENIPIYYLYFANMSYLGQRNSRSSSSNLYREPSIDDATGLRFIYLTSLIAASCPRELSSRLPRSVRAFGRSQVPFEPCEPDSQLIRWDPQHAVVAAWSPRASSGRPPGARSRAAPRRGTAYRHSL